MSLYKSNIKKKTVPSYNINYNYCHGDRKKITIKKSVFNREY